MAIDRSNSGVGSGGSSGRGEIGMAPSKLDPRSGKPLYLQLYDLIRTDILSGRLAPGLRLAASRSLAADLSVSRNTVVTAVEQLVAEGYLECRVGAGTFVSSELPDDLLGAAMAPAVEPPAGSALPGRVSRRGRLLGSFSSIGEHPPLRPLQPGAPAFDHLPHAAWSRTVHGALRPLPGWQLDYGDPRGGTHLRAAVARHLRALRGLDCDPAQVFIVGGSQQALGLAAQVLIDPGDEAWVEEPGYTGAKAALVGAGARLVPVPVGDDGLELAEGLRRAPRARLAYVTPSHQYPMGVTMSLRRRLELLAWAREARSWIVEDDYDSEFRYAGRPLAPLAALDPGGQVIYVGTFSKVLFPGLRLGYVVVPQSLVEVFAGARFAADRQPSHLEQAALSQWMEDGALARHIRRMRALYSQRSRTLTSAVERYLSGELELVGTGAGLHVVGLLPHGHDDQAVMAAAAAREVTAVALSRYFLDTPAASGLVLGFGAFEAPQIESAVRALAAVIATAARS